MLLKSFFIIFAIVIMGGFAYFSFVDMPITPKETVKPIPQEQLFAE